MDIVIYGKENCKFCKMAKDECWKYKIKFTYYDIETFKTDLLVELVTTIAPGAKTVPIVLIDGDWIGGYTELRHILKEYNNGE